MSFEHLWAGWRSTYVEKAAEQPAHGASDGDAGCVFCRILASGLPDDETHVVWRGRRAFAILNAYPYTNGHLLVMPFRHVAGLDDLDGDEGRELWDALTAAVAALKGAYRPDGLNVGANLGRAGGAGVPGHVHLHVLPRWNGDTNFMTSVADTRVMPETLAASAAKVRAAWSGGPASP